MPPYRCRSHDRSNCPDSVCRRQAERAGLLEPRAGRGQSPTGSVAEIEAVTRARAGELWVGPPWIGYGTDGSTRGSLAHLPGGVCVHHGENPDENGLYEGWGRIVDPPNAIGDLINDKPIPTTEGAHRVAVRLCRSCRALLG